MPKNKGFLEQPVAELDYIAGKSPIVHEDRIFDSNWSDYATDFELQKQNGFEPMDCVTQAIINSIQSQIQWFLDNGKLPDRIKKFLYKHNCIVNGRVQFSKKFIAILSETTPLGNYLTKVAQTVREVGVIPEEMLPISGKTWDEFYDAGQITDEMREFGKKLFDKDNPNAFFTLQYEWVVTPNTGGKFEEQRAKMLRALRHAPLVIAKSGHCTLKMLGVDKVKWQVLDSYKPFIKDRSWDYNALWVLKVIVDLKVNNKKMVIVKTKDKPHIYLVAGNKKLMIIDMPTLNALAENHTVITQEEMDRYEDGGTLIWTDRTIK
jgi:hypothetical protein